MISSMEMYRGTYSSGGPRSLPWGRKYQQSRSWWSKGKYPKRQSSLWKRGFMYRRNWERRQVWGWSLGSKEKSDEMRPERQTGQDFPGSCRPCEVLDLIVSVVGRKWRKQSWKKSLSYWNFKHFSSYHMVPYYVMLHIFCSYWCAKCAFLTFIHSRNIDLDW